MEQVKRFQLDDIELNDDEQKSEFALGYSPVASSKTCSPLSNSSIRGLSPISAFSMNSLNSAFSQNNNALSITKKNSPPLREKPLYANKRILVKIALRQIQQQPVQLGENGDEVQPEPIALATTTSMPEWESIDAMDEECFTLEPFESLIQTCTRANKEFILARVTTEDPADPSKHYFSYYAAYQINKVLFRTQPAEGLLHRMKARNPLNNMPIVGDVYYFAVTPTEVQRAWERNPDSQTCTENPASIPSSSIFSNITSSLSSSLSSSSQNSKQQKVEIVYNAKYVGTDDNFLMISSFREYFKKNSINPDDFTLFTLLRNGEGSGGNADGTGAQNSFRNLWGLLARRRNQPRWKVFTRRGLQVLMVVYIVVGFVLIKFVFSPNFAFLVGFILIMFFLFTLLFLVDCEA